MSPQMRVLPGWREDTPAYLRSDAERIGPLPPRSDEDTVAVRVTVEQAFMLLDDALIYGNYSSDSLPGVPLDHPLRATRCAVRLLEGIDTGGPFTLRAAREVLERIAEDIADRVRDVAADRFAEAVREPWCGSRMLLDFDLGVLLAQALGSDVDEEEV